MKRLLNHTNQRHGEILPVDPVACCGSEPCAQVWPTLQLTDEEHALFRRNGRLFVVDLGRWARARGGLFGVPWAPNTYMVE